MSLQHLVDSLLDNGRVGKPMEKKSAQPMESLAGRLKGKQGRMRLNLLGKRVDYSARTVIVVDPKLNLDECGLPYTVAKEMFKAFLIAELSKSFPDKPFEDSGELWMDFFDHLDEHTRFTLLRNAIGNRLVMLNRAPTLHRLSMQAFKPVLVGGQALKIHPLVCAPFNADFDGDTMAIHLALSDGAQEELRRLMVPSANLSSPASGEPVIGPTQDMVLGIYYLTADPLKTDIPPVPFDDLVSVAQSHADGHIRHDTLVSIPIDAIEAAAPHAVADDPSLAAVDGTSRLVVTTVGRVLFFLCVHCQHRTIASKDEQLLRDLDDALDHFQPMELMEV